MTTMAAFIPSLLGGLATSMIGSMLKEEAPPAPPPPPTPEAATPMPEVNDQERRAAARRSIATQMARRGRASTILTDNADSKLGG